MGVQWHNCMPVLECTMLSLGTFLKSPKYIRIPLFPSMLICMLFPLPCPPPNCCCFPCCPEDGGKLQSCSCLLQLDCIVVQPAAEISLLITSFVDYLGPSLICLLLWYLVFEHLPELQQALHFAPISIIT